MTNPNHNHNIDKLIEALRIYGIKTERIGCGQLVCSFPDGNYVLEMNPTGIPLEAAQQMEKARFCDHAEQCEAREPDIWKKAAAAALLSTLMKLNR